MKKVKSTSSSRYLALCCASVKKQNKFLRDFNAKLEYRMKNSELLANHFNRWINPYTREALEYLKSIGRRDGKMREITKESIEEVGRIYNV